MQRQYRCRAIQASAARLVADAPLSLDRDTAAMADPTESELPMLERPAIGSTPGVDGAYRSAQDGADCTIPVERVGAYELVVDFLDEFRLIGVEEDEREVLVEIGPIETVEVAPGLCQWHTASIYERQRCRLMRVECVVVVRLRPAVERDPGAPQPILSGVLHSDGVGSRLAGLATDLAAAQRRRADDLAERLGQQRDGGNGQWINEDSLVLERTRVAIATVEDDVRPVEGSRREEYRPSGPIFACGAVESELARRREERVEAEAAAERVASDALDEFFEKDLSEQVPEGFGERIDAAKVDYDEARWRRSMVALVLAEDTPTGFGPLVEHDNDFDTGSLDAPSPRPPAEDYEPPSDVIVVRPTNPVCHRIADLVDYLETEVEQLPARIAALEGSDVPLSEAQQQALEAGRELLPRLPDRLAWARELAVWCREEYDRIVFPEPVMTPDLSGSSLTTTDVSSRPVTVRMRWDLGAFMGFSGWYVLIESDEDERMFMLPPWVHEGYTVDGAALTEWLRMMGVYAMPLRDTYPADLSVDFDPSTDKEVAEMDRANPIWIFEGFETVWPDRSDPGLTEEPAVPPVVIPPPDLPDSGEPDDAPVPDGPRSPVEGGFWTKTKKSLFGAAAGGVLLVGGYTALSDGDAQSGGDDGTSDQVSPDDGDPGAGDAVDVDPDLADGAVDAALDLAEEDETLVSVVPLGEQDDGVVEFLAVFTDGSGGVSYSVYGIDGEGRDDSVDLTHAAATESQVSPAVASQMGGNTSYPCGAATSTYIATCQDGATVFPSGDHIIVVAQHAGPIAAGDGEYTYGLAFDDDGDPSDNYSAPPDFDADLFDRTEYWYRYQVDPDGTRTMWADGMRSGVPGVPRHSDAIVIESGSQLIWVIPRAEVPGDSLGFRVTAFRDGSPQPGTVPDPADSGGDLLGDRPDGDLFPVEAGPVVLDRVDGLPPDTETVIPRVELVGTPDEHRTSVLIDSFRGRLDAAVAGGDPAAVQELVHPQLLAGANGAECRRQMDESVALATAVRVLAAPSTVDLSTGIASYPLSAEIDYPTGTVAWAPILVPGPRGELYLFLPSCL